MNEEVGELRRQVAKACAAGVGAQADRYDRVRPGYPDALASALCTVDGLSVLDVGCGTGKAALPFLVAGCSVLGVEPDRRMAAIASSRGIEVEVASFEEWDDRGRRFDLVVAGQAWHRVDARVGPQRAVAVLRPSGRLAPFWNHRSLEEAMFAVLEPIYERRAPALLESSPFLGTLSREEELARNCEAITSTGLFEVIERLAFAWSTAYSALEWTDLARTQSDHRLLPERTLEGLLAEVGRALAEKDEWRVPYETTALVAVVRR